jgi:hypothetical protein
LKPPERTKPHSIGLEHRENCTSLSGCSDRFAAQNLRLAARIGRFAEMAVHSVANLLDCQ